MVIKLWGTSAFTGLDNPLASGSHLQKSQAILGPLQPGLAWPGGYGRSSMTEERATGCSSGQGGFFVPDLETGPEAGSKDTLLYCSFSASLASYFCPCTEAVAEGHTMLLCASCS